MLDLTGVSSFASEHRFALVAISAGVCVFALGFALPIAAVWSGVAGGFFAAFLFKFLSGGDD